MQYHSTAWNQYGHEIVSYPMCFTADCAHCVGLGAAMLGFRILDILVATNKGAMFWYVTPEAASSTCMDLVKTST